MLGLRLSFHRLLTAAPGLIVATTAEALTVSVDAYPVVAGQSVTIQYDPAGRVLDSASWVELHYGFNGWSPTSPIDPPMTWNAAESVWEVTVAVPVSAYQLDVVFNDGAGAWDNNGGADWHLLVIGGIEPWMLDGQLDDDATLIAEHGGYAMYAGLRDTTLYLAATGADSGNDHFCFLADSPGSPWSAPWDKAGTVAAWSAYVGNEVDNGWSGWFDTSSGGSTASGTWLEATIDLDAEFGGVPAAVYLAFGPYPTDGETELVTAGQVPPSGDGDGDIDANEYVRVILDSIRAGCFVADVNADCTVDNGDATEFVGCIAGPDIGSCVATDLDDDADTDLDDAAAMQLAFGSAPPYTAVIAEALGAGVTRFYPEGVDLAELPPSMSLVTEPIVLGPAAMPWVLEPQFFEYSNRKAVLVPVDDDVSLYGTGEVCGGLLRNGAVTEAWNTDAYGYGPWNPSLYQSHPWVLGVRPDGTAFGVLADTTYRCRIELSFDIVFAAEGPEFPIYVFEGATPQAVLTRLTDFIGRMALPPKWALGYHQCRYSYYPDSTARWLANEFRTRDIPCDAIWFDIDYMDGYRIFTFDPSGFPDPQTLDANLEAEGFHTVWMIDPAPKIDAGYFVYDQGCAGDHWVLDAAGSWFTGDVWPGACHFPDFTQPQTRAWWSSLYAAFLAVGVDGVWNDMNEPAVFGGPNHSMPLDNQHRGGGGLPAGPHTQYHNVYGMLMAQATREGVLAANPDKRPFVLSRASFIGGHRDAAMWTGDNIASWEHLGYSTPMVLNMGLSGQPFAGPDIGGYGGDAWDELMARWMGVGAFMPFCRGHYDGQGVDQEPWSFGSAVEATSRTALQRRYRLMPYLYTLFREAAETGLPVMRPVFFADLTDLSLRSEDVAFLMGSDLLVVPNVAADPYSAPAPALPSGIWRSVSLVGEDASADVDQPDVRVRGGAIVPLGPVMEHTGEAALDPLTLVICPDEAGTADGLLYEDAGDGFAYQGGDYRLAHYLATTDGDVLTVEVAALEGTFPTPARPIEVIVLTDSGVLTGAGLDNIAGVVATVDLTP